MSDMPGYIHHIEWSVSDLESISDRLINSFGFSKFAQRKCGASGARQVVVKSGKTVFVLTKWGGGSNNRCSNSRQSDNCGEYPFLFGSIQGN